MPEAELAARAEMDGIKCKKARRGLRGIADEALQRRGLPAASDDEVRAAEERSAPLFAQMRRLSLLEPLLGEMVELAVCLDRALALDIDSVSGAPSGQCGYIFKTGDIAWVCRTCQTDDTCVLCQDCFSNSDHEGHEVFFHRTRAGGCCDCGDLEAWKAEGCCPRHRGGASSSGGLSEARRRAARGGRRVRQPASPPEPRG